MEQKLAYVESFPPLDWDITGNDSERLASVGVAQTLTTVNVDGKLGPMLATSWTQTGPLTWVFTLRDHVEFQDGTPLNAEAVAFALNRALQAKIPARAFNPTLFNPVETVGANKVEITTPVENPLVPLYMGSFFTEIFSKSAYHTPPLGNGDVVNPLGTATGPFVITADNKPTSITLKGNTHYWGGKVNLTDVAVKYITDPQTIAADILSGDAQLVESLPEASLPELKADPNIKVVSTLEPATIAMYMNNAKAPFNNVLVRQAIQSAIDVNSLAKDVYEGSVPAAVGPFAAGSAFAPAGATPVPYDTAKALSLSSGGGRSQDAHVEPMGQHRRSS